MKKWNAVRRFLLWGDKQGLKQHQCLPAPEWVLCEYAATFAGKFAGGTAKSHLSAIKGWTIRRGHAYRGGENLRRMLIGVERKAPLSSRRKERPPVKEEHLHLLHKDLDLSGKEDGLDVCTIAAANTLFYGQIRSGKLLPSSPFVEKFDRKLHSTVACLRAYNADRSRRLKLPSTKMEPIRGEEIILSAQESISDPNNAIDRHIRINRLSPNDPLFSYRDKHSELKVLTKKLMLEVCNRAWSRHSVPRMTGHCFRIGGTTHYLLAGIPCDVVKVLGRWKSDAFIKYWRNLDSLATLHIHRIHVQRGYAAQIQALIDLARN